MPAVLVKDAQRHGLRIRSIDVQVSQWQCTIEHERDGELSLRMGLMYAKGLRQEVADQTMVKIRSQAIRPVPLHVRSHVACASLLQRKELTLLARIGALNSLDGVHHRRDAVWQVEEAVRPVGPLLKQHRAHHVSGSSPLRQMNTEERLSADYSGTGLTVGRHPLYFRRQELQKRNVLAARDLQNCKDGEYVRAAGCVIARQRPGTAKGFIFLSMEDETGIANVIITPDLYERERVLVTRSKFVLVEGGLQNQDGVIHIKARRIRPLANFQQP